jgi:hypothetical protein
VADEHDARHEECRPEHVPGGHLPNRKTQQAGMVQQQGGGHLPRDRERQGHPHAEALREEDDHVHVEDANETSRPAPPWRSADGEERWPRLAHDEEPDEERRESHREVHQRRILGAPHVPAHGGVHARLDRKAGAGAEGEQKEDDLQGRPPRRSD